MGHLLARLLTHAQALGLALLPLALRYPDAGVLVAAALGATTATLANLGRW
jgi:hypothetical protein